MDLKRTVLTAGALPTPADTRRGSGEKMGLFRKAASVSTLGAVNYRSKREKVGMAAKAEAELSREQAKLVREQRKAVKGEREAEAQQAAEGKPWYQQPTVGDALRARRKRD